MVDIHTDLVTIITDSISTILMRSVTVGDIP
jgi:hypothetical protein